MFQISKDFTFSASHQLSGLPDGHQCGRLHGHNYTVRLELVSLDRDLLPVGFVMDYGELKPFGRYLDNRLDHRHLNEVFDFNPTAELMARALYRVAVSELVLPQGVDVTAVSVSETAKTWATYRPSLDAETR